tara:strand:+ start:1001 stop:1828 length:828 start_codon:yes stop_codon:yes gene_type:complete
MDYARITRHVKTTHKHDISWDNYAVNFRDSLPMHNLCVVCNNNVVYKYQTCSPSCKSILLSQKSNKFHKENPDIWVGRKQSEETKKKRSNSMKGKPSWNKGLTKDSDERVVKQTENANKNRKPRKNYKHSIKTKTKISKATQGRTPWNLGVTHTPETIKKIVTHRKNNKLEEKVASILLENNIDFTHQYFLNRSGQIKSFDFFIKSKNLLLEIDGDYWHGGPGCDKHFFKLDEVKQNDRVKDEMAIDNGFDIVRIWESEINKNQNIILERIGKTN